MSRLPAAHLALFAVALALMLAVAADPAAAHRRTDAETTTYRIRPGDTVSGIAVRTGTTVNRIVALNGVRNANRIMAGRTLLVPAGGASTTAVASTAGSTGRAGSRHLVVPGDTLGGIAARYGLSPSDLARWNGLSGDRIYTSTSLALYDPGSPPSSSITCPVPGSSFTNDWAFPRSGGRVHLGTDLFAPRGTPFRAPVSGTVTTAEGPIGGLQIWLTDSEGNRWMGSHLDDFGATGWVSAGDVVGYVGDSGNARGTNPHLHLEYHPAGQGPVPLYATLRAAC